jgi:hypothetical protein
MRDILNPESWIMHRATQSPPRDTTMKTIRSQNLIVAALGGALAALVVVIAAAPA